MHKVKKFKAYNMVITSVGELLSFHPIFNLVVNLGITLVPLTIQHNIYIYIMLKISKITFSKSQNIMKKYSIS
jgi:hypothetical protein